MNDEIKEILDNIKEDINGKFEWEYIDDYYVEQIKPLLNYITNLQQENHDLKSQLECYENGVYYSSKVDELQQENERLKELNENASKVCMAEHKYGVDKAEEARDYKSRCEKAIEYIKEMLKLTIVVDGKEEEIIGYNKYLNDLLNILQNGSEKDDR